MHNYVVILEGKPVYIRIDFVNRTLEATVKNNGADLTGKMKLKEVRK